jgi:hypothetical protein
VSTLRRDNGIPAPRAPEPIAFRMDRIVLVGMGVWALGLIVTLLIPALHRGERDWWPWACVAGLALGLIGFLYVRRGRGNAADAHPPADPQAHY